MTGRTTRSQTPRRSAFAGLGSLGPRLINVSRSPKEFPLMKCSPVALSVLLVAFAVACEPATAPQEVPLTVPDVALGVGGGRVVGSATGSGHFQDLGGLRTFSFNAIRHADGSASGNAQFNNRLRNAGGNGLQFSMDIVCVNFLSQTRVAVVGAVKRVNPASTNPIAPTIPVGAELVFVAEDNGEGGSARPDRTSGWAPQALVEAFLGPLPAPDFSDVMCGGAHNGYVSLLFFAARDVEKGNIQVRAP